MKKKQTGRESKESPNVRHARVCFAGGFYWHVHSLCKYGSGAICMRASRMLKHRYNVTSHVIQDGDSDEDLQGDEEVRHGAWCWCMAVVHGYTMPLTWGVPCGGGADVVSSKRGVGGAGEMRRGGGRVREGVRE